MKLKEESKLNRREDCCKEQNTVNELSWQSSGACLSLAGGIQERDNSALVPRCLELSCPLCAQPGSTFDMSCPQLF